MALRLLGPPPIDIHAGGVDLIFPHHENEIAQSEGATGAAFSRFWFHVEHLMIDMSPEDADAKGTEKMSKSLGNVYNLQDVVDRGFRPSALRYLYLGVHYRKQLRFSWAAMAQAEEALKRLTDFLARLETLPARDPNPSVAAKLDEAAAAFAAHVTADVNTAAAIGVIFELVRALNSAIDAEELGASDADGGAGHVRSLRSGAGRPVAAPRRGRTAAGARRGDRRADRGAQAPPGWRATSPKPIASAPISRRAASCSRIPARRRGGRGSNRSGLEDSGLGFGIRNSAIRDQGLAIRDR